MKKKILISVCLILAILIFLSVSSVFLINRYSLSVSQGLYLSANDNTPMMIQMNSPIKLNNLTNNENLFDNFSDGDEILVIHDGIQESYPGATGVYAVFKLGDGDLSDIPENVLASLSELGWYTIKDNSPETEETTKTENTQTNNETVPSNDKKPPELQVFCKNVMVKAWLGTYSWFFENNDGTQQAIAADSPHPSECIDSIYPLPLTTSSEYPEKTFSVSLHFENSPDSISVRRYEITDGKVTDNTDYTEIPVNDLTIEAEGGRFLYEVIAEWKDTNSEHGTAYYAFCTAVEKMAP